VTPVVGTTFSSSINDIGEDGVDSTANVKIEDLLVDPLYLRSHRRMLEGANT